MREKRNITYLLIISLVILVAIQFVTGCSSEKESNPANVQNNGGNNSIQVRVGFFPNITHSQALVGRAKGSFAEALGESNRVEWKQFNAGPAEIEALFAGELDIGYIGPVPAINGYAKSKGDIQIIAGATNAGAILVTRKELLLHNIKELDGKRVSVPQYGNTQDLSLRVLLRQNELKDTAKGGTVEIHQVANPDVKVLFDKGEIDAALVPEPWGSRLVKEVGANVLLDYDKVWRDGNYSTAVVVVRTEFLNQHPELVEKFLRAHVELTNYINSNKNEAKTLLNAQIKELTQKPLEDDVLDAAIERLTVTNNPEKDSVLDFMELALDGGFLKEKPDTSSLFNLNILNKILQEKGLSAIN